MLPFEALTGLLMILPRMLQLALDERFPDNTLCGVHPPGDWQADQTESNNGVILGPGTRDGFEPALAVPDANPDSPRTAL